LVPISAEDFARAKRRVVLKWLALGLLIILVAIWVLRRSTSSQDSLQTLGDGEQLLKKGRYAEAIQSFDRALSADRGQVKAYILRGRANASLNQTEAALRDFTSAARLQPGSPDALVERAAVRLDLRDYRAVIADCGEAILRDAKVPRAYLLRGIARREMGDVSQSLDDFNHAVALSRDVDTYFQRATTYQLAGQHSKAIADLDQMIFLLPGNPLGYLARAKSRQALGDETGARADRETGRQLERRDPGQ
jgi:tetratricopeptide (TPR) repeat protein